MKIQPQYVKVAQLQDYGSLCKKTWEGFIADGSIPVIRLKGVRLVDLRDVDEFLKNHKEQSRAQAIADEIMGEL